MSCVDRASTVHRVVGTSLGFSKGTSAASVIAAAKTLV
jgi:hypothetical protein